MSTADSFKGLLGNLAINNAEIISLRYGEITRALNQAFRQTDSTTANSLRVGSIGRGSAIKGISDLDMLYIMPSALWETYKTGGQSAVLSATCKAIKDRYPNTTVKVDRLVVRVLYTDFHIEVQPVWEDNDGHFTYPDTYDGGTWKTTKPRLEIKAMGELDTKKNGNLRRLSKMARAWKNRHGLAMGGLLIDTLAHNFLNQTADYDDTSCLYCDEMMRDFLEFLADEPDQERYGALGSGQHVKVKKKFQKKAKKGFELCEKAIAAEGEAGAYKKWRKVFGRAYPSDAVEVTKAFIAEAGYQAKDTEEFIEDKFPVDIRYPITIDCRVTQNGFAPQRLRDMLARHFPLRPQKTLDFEITKHDVPAGAILYWKVLNRGAEAIRRDQVRGQIVQDAGQWERTETTTFKGDHVVECYAVLNGVVVATDRIHVPIAT